MTGIDKFTGMTIRQAVQSLVDREATGATDEGDEKLLTYVFNHVLAMRNCTFTCGIAYVPGFMPMSLFSAAKQLIGAFNKLEEQREKEGTFVMVKQTEAEA